MTDKKFHPLSDAMAAKWSEAFAHPGRSVDVGELVACDSCARDYTANTDACGGLIVGSRAICPLCTPGWLTSLRADGETHHIRARCPEGKSFWLFVVHYREEHGNNTITVGGKADE